MKHYIVFIYSLLIIQNGVFASNGYGYSESQQNMIRANNNIKTFNQTSSSSVKEASDFVQTAGATVANTVKFFDDLFNRDKKDKKDNKDESCNTKLDKLKKQYSALYDYISKEINKIIQNINNYNNIKNELNNLVQYNDPNYTNKIYQIQDISNTIHNNIIKLNEMLIYIMNLINNGGDVTTFLANGQWYEKLYSNNNNVSNNRFTNYIYPNNNIQQYIQYPQYHSSSPIINTTYPNTPIFVDNNRPMYPISNIYNDNGWRRIGNINTENLIQIW